MVIGKGTRQVVAFTDVSFAYGKVDIFSHLTIGAYEHETLAVVGKSGVGKSTLLRLMAGILRPRMGQITFSQRAMNNGWHKIGFVFQDYTLLPWLTAYQNIRFPLRLRRESNIDVENKIAHVARQLSIADALDYYPHQLSGGMTQRVAIARALVINPGLLCLDEPFSALDPLLRRDARQVIEQAITASDATVVMVTHDVGEALAVANRIFVLKREDNGTTMVSEICSGSHDWSQAEILSRFR